MLSYFQCLHALWPPCHLLSLKLSSMVSSWVLNRHCFSNSGWVVLALAKHPLPSPNSSGGVGAYGQHAMVGDDDVGLQQEKQLALRM